MNMNLLILDLKQALRHLMRRWVVSLLSVCGIATGMVCFILSTHRLWQQAHYDNFRPGYRQLHVACQTNSDSTLNFYVPRQLFGEAARRLGADNAGLLGYAYNAGMSLPDGTPLPGLESSGLLTVVSRSVPQLMGMHFSEGDPAHAFDRKESIVVRRGEALRVFGTDKAVGRQVWMDVNGTGQTAFTVSGVLDEPEDYSIMGGDWLVCSDWLQDDGQELWVNNNTQLIIRGDDAEQLSRELELIREPGERPRTFSCRPLRLYGMGGKVSLGWAAVRPLLLEWLLAVLLLASALLNWQLMNMTLFQSRLRGYQLRLSLGGGLAAGVRWMYAEVAVTALPAMLLTLVALEQVAAWLELPRPASVPGSTLWPCMLGLPVVMGLLAIHPLAVVHHSALRRFQGRAVHMGGHRAMLFVQLMVSAVFLMVTTTLARQLRYSMSSECIGFDNSRILRLFTREWDTPTVEALQQLMTARRPQCVEDFAMAPSALFGSMQNSGDSVRLPDGSGVNMQFVWTRPSVFRCLGLEAYGGRLWQPDTTGQALSAVVSDEGARLLQCTAPGTLPLRGLQMVNQRHRVDVQGVCHLQPRVMRSEQFGPHVRNTFPLLMLYLPDDAPDPYNHELVYIRHAPGQCAEAMAWMQGLMDELQIAPDQRDLTRESDYVGFLYSQERLQLRTTSLYTAISLLITLFGMVAMVGFTMERQRKSIALRRVYGADTPRLLRLYLRYHLTTVLPACVVAYPIARALLQWIFAGYKTVVSHGPWLGLLVTVAMTAVVGVIVWVQLTRAMREEPARVIADCT